MAAQRWIQLWWTNISDRCCLVPSDGRRHSRQLTNSATLSNLARAVLFHGLRVYSHTLHFSAANTHGSQLSAMITCGICLASSSQRGGHLPWANHHAGARRWKILTEMPSRDSTTGIALLVFTGMGGDKHS